MEDTTALRQRLWRFTTLDPETQCWVWTGSRTRDSYGKIKVAGRSMQVHRLAYGLIGEPFDPDLTLDHLCRNTLCWNPAHLEPVTNQENILRGVGPTAVNARKTHCVHGHELTPDNLRQRPGRPSHHRECLTCYRVGKAKARRRAA